MEVWLLLAHLKGAAVRDSRASEWMVWHEKMTSKLSAIKGKLWRLLPTPVPAPMLPSEPTPSACRRSGGHVKKVKLPSYLAG